MNTTASKRTFEKVLYGSLPKFILAMFLAVIALFVFDMRETIDPVLGFSILTVGAIIILKILGKSQTAPLIPCLLLMLIAISMFLDKNISALIGVNLKLYALAFGIGAVSALLYIFKNFKHLWSNFPIFRYLFIFSILNFIYSFSYYSDFRSWFSEYLNMLYYSQASDARYAAIALGKSGLTQEFSESQLGIYLFGLAPLVAVTVSLLVFHGINKLETVKETLYKTIKYISYAFTGYFMAAAMSLALGLSVLSIGNQGRLDVSFLGIYSGADLFLAVFLILFIGFMIISGIAEPNKDSKRVNVIQALIIATISGLILASINKTCIIALVLSLAVFAAMLFKSKIFSSNLSVKKPVFMVINLVILGILAVVILSNPDAFASIGKRFSSIDTLLTRMMMWQIFVQDWFYHITPFTAIFGHGIDSSRELTFFVSSMIREDNSGIAQPHIHNMFLHLFYEYGLMAIFYILALASIMFSSVKSIFIPDSSKEVKLLSMINLSLVVFFFVYHMSYVIKIPVQIIFFSLLGFVESAKFALLKSKTALN